MTAVPYLDLDAAVVEAVEEKPRCSSCEHDLDDHDHISLRYCRATAAQQLVRGCVCPA